MQTLDFLVAGAGYVGERLLHSLPAATSAGIRRKASAGPPPVIAVDFDGPIAELPPARTLIYTVPPAADSDGDPRLARMLAALPIHPDRIVYFSTSGVYGDTGGKVVDESAEPRPTVARSQRRVDAERLLAAYCDRQGVELCILRVPGIYGPGRLGLDRIRQGRAILRDADAGPGNRIHVDDLVSCALAAASNLTVPRICNVGDGNPMPAGAFSRAVANAAGLPAPPEVSMAEAERQFSEQRLSFLRGSRQLDLGRMREQLQVTPRYADPVDGIRASLAAENEKAG